MEGQDVKECVEKENNVWLDRNRIQQNWDTGPAETIRHESRLDHNKRVVHVFAVQNMSRYKKEIQTGNKQSRLVNY
jgi:hypothetical protein